MVNPRGVVADADPIGDALHMLRLTGALLCRADVREPFGVTLPALPGFVTLPVVLSGRALIRVGDERHLLDTGGAALLTRGVEHRMSSTDRVPCPPLFDLPAEVVSERYERMSFGGSGDRSRIAYAVFRIDDPLTSRFVAELPDVIRVDTWDGEEGSAFQTVLRLLAREAVTTQPGGETVMTRLADVLVIQVLRQWLARGDPRAGWIAALEDRHVGRTLARMHRDPGHDWSLEDLASEAGLSRSAYADRFTRLVGEPPMRYLAGWRLEQARAELERGTDPVGLISQRVGYGSEAAFTRAFRRRHAATPSQVRQAARTATDGPRRS